ncbi:MAG: phosphatase PAP2 family protein [Akkermansiaceae bacterium]|nr:phosphatase PAP2 family protein [Akkermansiaceae bacterium]
MHPSLMPLPAIVVHSRRDIRIGFTTNLPMFPNGRNFLMEASQGSRGEPVLRPADGVEGADVAAGAAVAQRRHHPVLKTLGHFGEIGDQGPLYLIGTSVLVAGVFRKDSRCFAGGLAVLAAVATADLIKSTVKNNVTRSRPNHSVEQEEYRFETGGSPRKEEQSFPSGHTACTVAASEAAISFYPGMSKYLRPLAVIMTASRLAKGHHWPLDLFAGVVIGKLSQKVACHLLYAIVRILSRPFC